MNIIVVLYYSEKRFLLLYSLVFRLFDVKNLNNVSAIAKGKLTEAAQSLQSSAGG